MSQTLNMMFELSEVEYVGFMKKLTRMNVKTIASQLPGVQFEVKHSEYLGLHLVEINLDTEDSTDYDLVGKITRMDNNRQWVDLLGQFVNTTNADYKNILTKKDIRELPCDVCGVTLKRRRNMFVILENSTGEYEHVGSECVQKLIPEWSAKKFQQLYEKLIKLQSLYHDKIKAERPNVNGIEVIQEAYNSWFEKNMDQPQTKEFFEKIYNHFKNDFQNNVMPNFYQGAILSKQRIGAEKTEGARAIAEMSKSYNTQGMDFDKSQKIYELESEFNEQSGKVRTQFNKGKSFYAGNVKKIAQRYNNFNDFIDTIKATREFPNKPGYNLREVVGAKQVRPELVGKVKQAVWEFLSKRMSYKYIVDEVDKLDKKPFESLTKLDEKFSKVAIVALKKRDELTKIDIKF